MQFKRDIPLNLYKLCDGIELCIALFSVHDRYLICICVPHGKAPCSQEQAGSKTSLAPLLSCIRS